jgi:hypothetical protein
VGEKAVKITKDKNNELWAKNINKPCKEGKSWAKTSKYSSSLIPVPTGSTTFTNPEKVNITPTIIRAICENSFIK